MSLAREILVWATLMGVSGWVASRLVPRFSLRAFWVGGALIEGLLLWIYR